MKQITIDSFTKFLEEYPINKEYAKFKNCEYDLKGELNPIVLLNKIFWKENKIISFDDFFNLYYRQYGKVLENKFKGCDIDNLKARLYRTQISAYTEYHAILLLKKLIKEEFQTLNLNKNNDLDTLGIDCIIENSYYNRVHYIHIFVSTNRGHYFRNYKEKFKKTYSKLGIHVDFFYSISSSDCIYSVNFLKNGFGVYKEEYCRYLLKKIIDDFFYQCLKKNKNIVLDCEGYICK